MNRRNFIKLSLFVPFGLLVKVEHVNANTLEDGLKFPFMFEEKESSTNKVEITNFKNEGFFSQLWHELLQLTK